MSNNVVFDTVFSKVGGFNNVANSGKFCFSPDRLSFPENILIYGV